MQTEPWIELVSEPGKPAEPRVRWGKKGKKSLSYPVIHLGEPAAPTRLPGERVFLGDRGFIDQPLTLIFGEPSGGGRDLISWWKERLDDASRPWVYVQGDKWRADFFKPKERVNRLEVAKEGKDSVNLLEQLGTLPTHIEKAEAFVRLAEHVENPFHLILRDLGGLGEEQGKAVAHALRSAGEEQVVREKLRIVIVSSSEGAFEDQYDASGLAPMCERYRLAALNEEEVKLLAGWQPPKEHRLPKLTLSNESLNKAMKATGGQVLLVQRLLDNLRRMAPSSGDFKPDDRKMHKALQLLTKSPPSVTGRWKEDLRQRLEGNPDLIPVMRSYARGESLGGKNLPPPSTELGLMIGGWVRQHPTMDRWGIASKFHAHFAKQVLDRF
jgi:hypothetical protein